ncbi:hypothetical protein AWV79_07145 [Cupriavidus sp. UYMMa02A]|nr:hypothetical protein AWV79_07145 [Cupriavidus sp. UYMMa02A]
MDFGIVVAASLGWNTSHAHTRSAGEGFVYMLRTEILAAHCMLFNMAQDLISAAIRQLGADRVLMQPS